MWTSKEVQTLKVIRSELQDSSCQLLPRHGYRWVNGSRFSTVRSLLRKERLSEFWQNRKEGGEEISKLRDDNDVAARAKEDESWMRRVYGGGARDWLSCRIISLCAKSRRSAVERLKAKLAFFHQPFNDLWYLVLAVCRLHHEVSYLTPK